MKENTSNYRALLLVILFGIIAIAAATVSVRALTNSKTQRLSQEVQSLATSAESGPAIQTILLAQAPSERTTTLLGEAQPFLTTTVYAKVSGYLKEIRVDKGDRVTTNEVIGIIESPELDHQYEAALADQANKEINAKRAETLVQQDMISHQEAEQAETDATMAAQNVAMLATERSYETLHAPFDGVVTARFADPGALVQNAANSQTSALPVVTIAQMDMLRVYVYVPQSDAPFVHLGDPVTISLPYRPDLKLSARVTRTSNQLDERTRTLLTEIDFRNRDSVILPGSFVNVTLATHAPVYEQIPAQALVFQGTKPFVAVVEQDNRLKFIGVTILDDDGQNATIAEHLPKDSRIAINLAPGAVDGERVQPSEQH